MSVFDYPVRDMDITTIPTGADGKPDPTRYVALLQQMNMELTETLKRARIDADQWRAGIGERDAQIKALQRYEYRVLQKWLRRSAIVEARHDHILRFVAILAGILAVGLPLSLVVIAFAWRLATWAIAG
jgi:hypothetical protein